MRDVVEKAKLVVPNDLGNTGFQILAGAIKQKHTKVRMGTSCLKKKKR